MKKKEESTKNYMKRVVTLCLVTATVYVIVSIIFQCVKGEELSPTLTQFFLGGVIGELAATALIKVGEGWIETKRIKYYNSHSEYYGGYGDSYYDRFGSGSTDIGYDNNSNEVGGE